MFANYNIALEMLIAGAKNSVCKDIEAWVIECRRIRKNRGVDLTKPTETLAKQIKDKLGINTEIIVVPDDLQVNVGMWSDLVFFGHGGSRSHVDPGLKVFLTTRDGIKLATTIDLKTGKVSGGIADHMRFKIVIGTGVLYEVLGFTVTEVTAMMLHELGHCVDTFMHLGEYVYLNYYLTEGIEVLQGKKPNVYKLEMLDEKWLLNNMPEDLIDDFTNGRSEDTVRKAILTTFKKAPRHHITNNPLASKLRNEQMADNFVSRLGYSRDLAMALYKIDKYYPDQTERQYSSWLGQMLKIMLMIAVAPITAFMIALYNPLDDRNTKQTYDKPMERMLKIRRDLIQQLKLVKRVTDGRSIVEDIEAIDVMLKEYSSHTDIFDSAITLLRPTLRKMQQNLKVEQDLESLLNNDLFLNAFKLNNL